MLALLPYVLLLVTPYPPALAFCGALACAFFTPRRRFISPPNRLFTNIRSINLPLPTETRQTRFLNSGTPANGLAGDGVKPFGSWTRLIALITPLNLNGGRRFPERSERNSRPGLRASPAGSPRGFHFQHGGFVSRCFGAGAIFTAKPLNFSRPTISFWIEIIKCRDW